jgi:hypothetical protein
MKKMFCRFLIDNSLRAASVSVRAIAVVPPVKSGRSTRMVIQQCLMLAALVGIGKVATAQTQVVTNWAAFNDHRPTVGVTHDNATGYDMRMTGNGGILKDFFTGADLPVQLVVENTGAVPDDFGANNYPADGSPAFNLFNGIVDVGNSGTPGIRNSAATILSLTFTNLDPAKKYLFRGTSVRGNNYPDRWAVYTIVSADAFTDAHALGDPNNPNNTGDPSNPNLITKTTFDTATLTNGQVALNSGENRLGSLVGWNDINPGPDGAFSVLAAQYIGLTPFGNPSAGRADHEKPHECGRGRWRCRDVQRHRAKCSDHFISVAEGGRRKHKFREHRRCNIGELHDVTHDDRGRRDQIPVRRVCCRRVRHQS